MKSLRSQLPEAVEDKLDTMRNTDDSYWILVVLVTANQQAPLSSQIFTCTRGFLGSALAPSIQVAI